ncbi:MAG: hypothetical protein WAU61_08040 [Smithella sp.]
MPLEMIDSGVVHRVEALLRFRQGSENNGAYEGVAAHPCSFQSGIGKHEAFRFGVGHKDQPVARMPTQILCLPEGQLLNLPEIFMGPRQTNEYVDGHVIELPQNRKQRKWLVANDPIFNVDDEWIGRKHLAIAAAHERLKQSGWQRSGSPCLEFFTQLQQHDCRHFRCRF